MPINLSIIIPLQSTQNGPDYHCIPTTGFCAAGEAASEAASEAAPRILPAAPCILLTRVDVRLLPHGGPRRLQEAPLPHLRLLNYQ